MEYFYGRPTVHKSPHPDPFFLFLFPPPPTPPGPLDHLATALPAYL